MTHVMRQQWVMGNWKMNPLTRDEATQLATSISQTSIKENTNLAVAPSMLHLQAVADHVTNSVMIMSQDLCAFSQAQGAYTGDVSAEQLADSGVGAVLIGHSERRQYHAETDDVLIEKMKHALSAGLMVVFCVGEQQAEREAGTHLSVVAEQVRSVLEAVTPNASKLIIAYEPVWAIGTGLSASADDAQAMHAHIRNTTSDLHSDYAGVSILYGGSVKPANAPELAACDDIDGALVGGASLDAAQFLDIYRAFG